MQTIELVRVKFKKAGRFVTELMHPYPEIIFPGGTPTTKKAMRPVLKTLMFGADDFDVEKFEIEVVQLGEGSNDLMLMALHGENRLDQRKRQHTEQIMKHRPGRGGKTGGKET